LSVYDYIQQHAPDVLRRFIDKLDGVGVAALDEQRKVVACNNRFAELANLAEPKGAVLSDFAEPAQEGSIVLPPEGTAWKMTIRLTNRNDESAQSQVQVLCENGVYFLFYSEPICRDDYAMGTMARLNDELGALNRELEKKTQELEEANETIRHMARTDALTGLANRRHFQEELEPALAAARRHEFPVSIAMGDLDHFKTINDTFGHEVGDEALVLFAQILKNSSRQEDTPARWGGEEFIVLMPHTAVDEACNLAERLRKQLAESKCPHIDRAVTASFGVAQFDAMKDDAADFVARVDEALYKAKENGRNQIATASTATG